MHRPGRGTMPKMALHEIPSVPSQLYTLLRRETAPRNCIKMVRRASFSYAVPWEDVPIGKSTSTPPCQANFTRCFAPRQHPGTLSKWFASHPLPTQLLDNEHVTEERCAHP